MRQACGFIAFYAVFLPFLAFAEFTGRVVGVSDGDTITVLHNGKGERVRLHGIDCPEKGQAFGTVAKRFTSTLVYRKDVTVTVYGQDKRGRTIGEVTLLHGSVLNHELVKAGLAWWFRLYAPVDPVLEGLEKEAREAKRGLWVDPNPVPPWEWRNKK